MDSDGIVLPKKSKEVVTALCPGFIFDRAFFWVDGDRTGSCIKAGIWLCLKGYAIFGCQVLHGNGLIFVINVDKTRLVRACLEGYFTHFGLETVLELKGVVVEWGCCRDDEKLVPAFRGKKEV